MTEARAAAPPSPTTLAASVISPRAEARTIIASLPSAQYAGAGNYYLGAREVTVGGDNLSTTVSGVISDCGPTGTECNQAGATGGALVKIGTGTLTLTGANTYTGGTTISAGTLQLGNGGTSGSIIGNVVDDGTFAITAPTPTRSAASSPAPAPSSRSAAARPSSPATTPLAAARPLLPARWTRQRRHERQHHRQRRRQRRLSPGRIHLRRAISGTGAFQQLGSGTSILTGNNTYGGGTTITAGTLQLGNGGRAAASSATSSTRRLRRQPLGRIHLRRRHLQHRRLPATRQRHHYPDPHQHLQRRHYRFGWHAAGWRGKHSSSSSTFSVSSGATLDLNSISQTIGSLAGNGNVTLGSATLTTGGNDASTTFSGTISGAGGQVIKTGDGTFVLSGTNSYTGGTRINSAHSSDSSGVLQVTNNSSVGTGTVTLNGGAFQAGADGLSFSSDRPQ